MVTFITRLAVCALALLSITARASADDGAVYDITHFDVLPVTSPYDSEQIAYAALFNYRDASEADPGSECFRIVNWLAATNHSFIVDVWKNRQAFEAHLAQPHSVAFRFAVQILSGPDTGCCIGSPIDDRQYTLVKSFATPFVSTRLPETSNVLAQTVVIDITNGNIVKNLTEIGGKDEVWYDRASNHYYLAASSNTDNTGKPLPELGVVDAGTNMFDGSVATSTASHSVAASRLNEHVFLPIGFVPPGSPAGTDPTNPCPTKCCIAVYLPSGSDNDQIAGQLNNFLKEARH